jgi:hypothetical protein
MENRIRMVMEEIYIKKTKEVKILTKFIKIIETSRFNNLSGKPNAEQALKLKDIINSKK